MLFFHDWFFLQSHLLFSSFYIFREGRPAIPIDEQKFAPEVHQEDISQHLPGYSQKLVDVFKKILSENVS